MKVLKELERKIKAWGRNIRGRIAKERKDIEKGRNLSIEKKGKGSNLERRFSEQGGD